MRAGRVIFLALLSFVLMACTSISIATQVLDENARSENPPIPVTGDIEFGGRGGLVVNVINLEFEQAIVEQTN